MKTDSTIRILRLINHDEQFELNVNRSSIEPIILNKIDLTDPNYTEKLAELIFSDVTGSDFDSRCECNATQGDNKAGMICPICHTEVIKQDLLEDDNLVCQNWLSCPKELVHGWITPKVYMTLKFWLTYNKNKSNYLDDILDTTTPIPNEISHVVTGKGFTYLYENFDRIMSYFIHDHRDISKKTDTVAIKYFLYLNADKIWCHYIPVLNSAINPIVASEGVGANQRKYSDITADFILNAAISLSQLEFSQRRRNRLSAAEKTTFKAYKNIIEYIDKSTTKHLSVKKALPRAHIFGSRFHWSYRGVIVPIIGPHHYYELHVPWRLAVNTLRVHIAGVLGRHYNLTLNEIAVKVREALNKVDPDIKKIMDDLIEESPFPGIPSLWHRPPSIRDGSVMLKFWTKIKTDLDDNAIGITPIDVALPNADFDGDNLAGIIIPEVAMAKAMKHLSPAALIYDANELSISSNIGLHNSLSITWNSFLMNC